MSHARGLSPQHVAALAEAFACHDAAQGGLRRLCEIAVEVAGASSAGVLFTRPGRSLCGAVSTDPRAQAVTRVQLATGQGPSIDAFHSQEAVIVPGPPSVAARRWPAFATSCAEAGFTSAWSVPLTAGARRLGALGLLREGAGGVPEECVADARVLARLAAALLAECRRREEARRVVGQLGGALTTRAVIEQAKGRLAERHGLPAGAAFERLRRHARDHNLKIHAVAAAVARGELRL